MRVQVVFLADVPPKHMAGDVHAVSGGYARNYLIPQGLAAPATADQLKRIAKIRQAAEAKRARDAADLQSVAEKLEGLSVTLKGRSGQGGHLYGSITTMAIAEALTDAVGHEIDRRIIQLTEPIRDLGTYQVPVRLHMDLSPMVTVVVEDSSGRFVAADAVGAAEAPVDEAAADAEDGSEPAAESDDTADDAADDAEDDSEPAAESDDAADDADEVADDDGEPAAEADDAAEGDKSA